MVSRCLDRIKALFLNLSVPVPVLEARNSTGVAGAPYGEHGPLQDGAGNGDGLCALPKCSHFNAEHSVCHCTKASAFRVTTALI